MSDGLTLEKLKVNDRLIELEKISAGSKEILEQISKDVALIHVKVGIQNGRVGKLENWQSWMYGGFAMVGFLFSMAAVLISYSKH